MAPDLVGPMLKLSTWLARKNLSGRAFGRMLGLASPTVQKYCAGRVPQPEVVAGIFRVTAGEVEPNDLYRIDELDSFSAARSQVVEAALALAEAATAGEGREQSRLCEAARAYREVKALLKARASGSLGAAA